MTARHAKAPGPRAGPATEFRAGPAGLRAGCSPWYRQFWPWFLIALPGSVVIAGLATLYIAHRHADDLVVDAYYRDGLAINVQLEKRTAAAQLGLAASVQILDRRIQVRLRGLDEAVAYLPELQLQLSHPLEADRDFPLTLQRVAAGLFDATMPAPVAPNWHWILADPQGNWRLDGSLRAADFVGYSPASPRDPG